MTSKILCNQYFPALETKSCVYLNFFSDAIDASFSESYFIWFHIVYCLCTLCVQVKSPGSYGVYI